MSENVSDSPTVKCPRCGAKNRLSVGRAGKIAVCGRCKSPLERAPGPLVVTDSTFASDVEASPLPVLLDLWAEWCGPCRMIAPILEGLAVEMQGKLRVAKLNIDENPLTPSRFGVRSIPTLLVLKGGREVGRIVGAQPKSEIIRQLQSMLRWGSDGL